MDTFRLNYLGKYTIILDSTNFMAASENSLSVWTTIWPDFTFRKVTFLIVLPTSFIGTLPMKNGLSHCRTSTVIYSKTFFLLIVEI